MCFEAIHREGGIENGRLFYNIGNIYFRLGDTGKAILNYRRAERFIPNDVNLQQNLNYARSRCVDRIDPKPQTQVFRTIFFWHYDLSGPTRSWLFAVLFGLLGLLGGMYLLKRRSWLPYAIMGCAVLSLLLAGSLGVEAYEESNIRSGVILEQEVIEERATARPLNPPSRIPCTRVWSSNLLKSAKAGSTLNWPTAVDAGSPQPRQGSSRQGAQITHPRATGEDMLR